MTHHISDDVIPQLLEKHQHSACAETQFSLWLMRGCNAITQSGKCKKKNYSAHYAVLLLNTSSTSSELNLYLSQFFWQYESTYLGLCFSFFILSWGNTFLSLSCHCFFSTRESLASNTSSIVESNRRQNPALSPGHMGTTSIGPPFSFRAIPEPPTTQPEKLQKSPNCLASITSVWHGPIWGDVRPGWSAMLGCLSAGGWVTPSIKHLDYMGTVKPTGMTSRDCSYSIKRSLQKKEKREKIKRKFLIIGFTLTSN